MRKRTIAVLTGTRAEYGLLKPVMEAIAAQPGLRLKVLAAGMHFAREFGYTARQITADGFTIDAKIPMHPADDSPAAMAAALGKGVSGAVRALRKVRPDILLVLGDRTEPLAGVLAAAYQNIPVAHIHGGDTCRGGLDESARHAITKFAHLHLPATAVSARRIEKLGEEKNRIHAIGAPGLDTILHTPVPDRRTVCREYGLDPSLPFLLGVQHAVSTEPAKAGAQIKATLAAVKELKVQTVFVYPNSDPGGRVIISALKKASVQPFIRTYKNLPRASYLGLLKHAAALVGNSSSGMIESSSFKTPVVNIGIRQEGRERSTNVLDVPHRTEAIAKAVRKAMTDKAFLRKVSRCKNPYGNGTAGKKAARILASVKINDALLQKKITY